MKLETTMGFPREVTQAWRNEVDKAIEEREGLGIHVPEDFKVVLGFYQTEAVASAISRIRGKNVLSVNMLHALPGFGELSKEDKEAMGGIGAFMTIASDAFNGVDEREAFNAALSDNPRDGFESIFKRQYGSSQKEKVRELMEGKGKPIEDYIDDLCRRSAFVRERIGDARRIIREAHRAGRVDFSPIRHELDHLAFFEGRLKGAERRLLDETAALYIRQMMHGKGSKELAEANMRKLKFFSGWLPLVESGGHVFSVVSYGGWEELRRNPERAKKDALRMVIDGYITNRSKMGFPYHIADALVSKGWAEGRMNRQTSNFIFQHAMGGAGKRNYNVVAEEVDFDAASDILFRELPEWQEVFYHSAVAAADSLVEAYRTGPSRLKGAYLEAGTFEDFRRMCEPAHD